MHMASQRNASIDAEPTALPSNYGLDIHEESHEATPTIIHLSCASCKHYNKHRSFDIPRDESSHLRITCERCGYQMIGFGRSSTQTTLASIETLPINSRGKPRPRNKRICTDTPQALHVGPPFAQRISSHLTPLDEQSSRPPSSQRVLEAKKQGINEVQAGNAKEAGHTNSYRAHTHEDGPKPTRRGGLLNKIHHRSLLPRLKGLRNIGRQLRDHARNFNIHISPRHRRSRTVTSLGPSDQDLPESAGGHHIHPDSHSSKSDSKRAEYSRDDSNTLSQTEPDMTYKAATHFANSGVGTVTSDSASKEERMKQFRHQKTLQSEAVSTCECGSNCSCQHDQDLHHNSGRATDGDVMTRIPGYLLDRESRSSTESYRSMGPFRDLATRGIGRHLFSTPSSTANSGATGDNLSQAATQIGSNDSMSSQNTRRDSSPRRPLSSSTQTSAPGGLRNSGLRPSNFSDWRAPSPLHQSSTPSGTDSRSRPSSSESQQSGDLNPSHGTRLGSLFPPTSMQRVMDQPLITTTRTVDGRFHDEESQQVTPTPSNIQTDGSLPAIVPLPQSLDRPSES